MKRILLAASLVAAPTLASAVPISESHDFVDVEYWGRLDRCDGACSNLPNELHGSFVIDLSRAPRDLRPDEAFGHYERSQFGFVSSAFVTTPSQTLRGVSEDQVIVADHGLSRFESDTYRVRNLSSVTIDGTMVAMERLEIGLFSFQSDWGIEGDSIVQEFDVHISDIAGEGTGLIETLFNGVHSRLTFFVDRMRATPRVCRP